MTILPSENQKSANLLIIIVVVKYIPRKSRTYYFHCVRRNRGYLEFIRISVNQRIHVTSKCIVNHLCTQSF